MAGHFIDKNGKVLYDSYIDEHENRRTLLYDHTFLDMFHMFKCLVMSKWKISFLKHIVPQFKILICCFVYGFLSVFFVPYKGPKKSYKDFAKYVSKIRTENSLNTFLDEMESNSLKRRFNILNTTLKLD